MSRKYWQTSGLVGRQLHTLFKQWRKAVIAMHAFAKKNGSDQIGTSFNGFVTFTCVFDKHPGKGWKLYKGTTDQYVPLASSELGKQRKLLCAMCPPGNEFGRLIGMKGFVGDRFRIPGVAVRHNVVYLTTTGDYTPPARLAKDLKRISDLEYEKVFAKSKRKKKASK